MSEIGEAFIDSNIDLRGQRILVVEGDVARGSELCRNLKRYGATVLGPAPTSHYAYLLLMGRRGIDGAVLHINSYRRELCELAESLQQRGVPMIFATDGEDISLGDTFGGTPRFAQPLEPRQLAMTMNRLIQTGPVIVESAHPPPDLAQPLAVSTGERMNRAVAHALRHASGA